MQYNAEGAEKVPSVPSADLPRADRVNHFFLSEITSSLSRKIYLSVFQKMRGRFAIVTERWMRDAMDAAVSKANEAADGEVVWS